MIEEKAFKEKFNFKNIFKYLKYKLDFSKNNPDYFHCDGLLVFTGPQGSGKTLSAVNYVYKLMKIYPNSILVTNIELNDYPIVTFQEFLKKQYGNRVFDNFEKLSDLQKNQLKNDYLIMNKVFYFQDADDLMKFENSKNGVIYLIDEIQLYFNSLQSKNIDINVMTEISQQRKQRKHIVCTSQVFGRLAKPFREQFNSIVLCKNFLGCIQSNSLIDRDSITDEDDGSANLKGKVIKRSVYVHSPMMYKRYDTYYKIKNTKFEKGKEETKIYV